ncbi:MAG: polysaccharide deacetylase family protein [Gemmatimonas sp.]
MPSDGRASRWGARGFFAAIGWAAFGTGVAATGVISPLLAVLGFLPLVIAIMVGVRFPYTGVFARPLHRGISGRRELALTFDDGPDPRWTPALLDLLESRKQRATFFVIGKRAAQHPVLLQDMVRRGHEIANHTWSHSYLTPFMSPQTLSTELTRTDDAVFAATGQRLRWFRPPVGLLSPRVALGAARANVDIVCWSATARDGTERTSVDDAFSRLEPAISAGAILVLHDARIKENSTPNATEVVSRLLDRMDSMGLRSVTLSELFAPR